MSAEPGIIAEVVFRCLLYIIGCAGNILVIFFILMLREDKKVTHWYVLQLALADFLFLQTLPFRTSEILHQQWIYPVWACRARQTVLFFNYYSSTIFLMIMGLDRYLAVCHGLSSAVQRLRSNKAVYIVTVCTWSISILLCIPAMMYSEKVGINGHCNCILHFPKDMKMFCTMMDEDLDICVQHYTSTDQPACFPPFSLSRPNVSSSFATSNATNASNTEGSAGGDGYNYLDDLYPGSENNATNINESGMRSENGDSETNGNLSDEYDYLAYLYRDYESNETNSNPSVEKSENGNSETDGTQSDEYDYLADLYRDSGSNETNTNASVEKSEKRNSETNVSGSKYNMETSLAGSQVRIENGCEFPRDRPGMYIFVYFNFIVMFLFPLMVITVCYFLISLRLSKTMATGPRKSSAGDAYHSSADGRSRIVKPKRSISKSVTSTKSHREKTRVTVMCVVLVSLFVICWLPFHTVNVALVEGIKNQSSQTCQNLAKFAAVFAYLNSALNPYLYNFLGTFRKKLRQVNKTSAMQSFLSATGMTRIGRRASENITSASESVNRSRRSTAFNEQVAIPSEGVPLTTMNNKE